MADTYATAVARPGIEQFADLPPDQRLLAWLQQQYEADPQGTSQRLADTNLGQHYRISDGRVEAYDPHNWLIRNPWVFAAGGAGAAGALGALGAAGGAAAATAPSAATGGAASGASTAVPAIAGGAPGALGTAGAGLAPTAAGLAGGSAAAGAGSSLLSKLLPAAITAGSSIAGGVMGSRAANNAAEIQAQAADKALQLQRDIWNQQQQNFAPYLGAGQSALGQLSGLMTGGQSLDKLASDPWYQFQRDQGLQGIDRLAAAKGTLLTGGTLKDAMSFASGLASQQGDKQYQRLFDLANLGQNSAAGVGNFGNNFASNAGSLITGQGNALAAGTIGSANAWGNTLGQLANLGTQMAVQYPWQAKQTQYSNPNGWYA